MKNNPEITHTPKELLAELQALIGEAQSMMSESISEHSAEAMSNLRERFDAAQERFSEAYAGARKQVVAGAKYTDEKIRANPYQSIAIAAGVGLLIGIVAGRRSK